MSHCFIKQRLLSFCLISFFYSQGPTKDIINDFWRMIWQEGTDKIVMLTNLEEDDKVICIKDIEKMSVIN